MVVKTINSGSKGNGYALISGEDVLLLECGVPAKDMLKTIDYQISKVSGCMVSHVHKDHVGYIKQYMQYTPFFQLDSVAVEIPVSFDT